MSSPSDDAGRLADLRALELLRPLMPGVYLPWTDASIRPAALAVVCNDVVIRRRRALVEFGAGISTLVLGRLARQVGGTLVSVEHDPEWIGVVDALVAGAGLQDVVRLHHAPIDAGWYATGVVRDAVQQDLRGRIDLALVDGPPAWRPGTSLARLPAGAFLHDLLVDGATVVLDDAGRDGEAEVLRRWEAAHGWVFDRRDEGIAVAVLGDSRFVV